MRHREAISRVARLATSQDDRATTSGHRDLRMPPAGVTDRLRHSEWRQKYDAQIAAAEKGPNWDLEYHHYYRINSASGTVDVKMIGPHSEEYGAPGWVKATKQFGLCANREKAARAEGLQALTAEIAQRKIAAHASSGAVVGAGVAPQKEITSALADAYDQKHGAGSSFELFAATPAPAGNHRGFTLTERAVVLAVALGDGRATQFKTSFDQKHGAGAAAALCARVGVSAPAPIVAAQPPVVAAAPAFNPPPPAMATTTPLSRNKALAASINQTIAARSERQRQRLQQAESAATKRAREVAAKQN